MTLLVALFDSSNLSMEESEQVVHSSNSNDDSNNAIHEVVDQSSKEEDDEYFMRQALRVAKRALQVGEVPVGCVIVLSGDHPVVAKRRKEHQFLNNKKIEQQQQHHHHRVHSKDDRHDHGQEPSSRRRGVVISHGANQVNMTRDATRHAEIVAIDRLLTEGASSDELRIPLDEGGERALPSLSSGTSGLQQRAIPASVQKARQEQWEDRWIHTADDGNEEEAWRNSFGWRNNGEVEEFRSTEIFASCDLYVTCEPCLMCAAALATVGIRRVIFGCKNDRFGGCGSLLNLHQPETGEGLENNDTNGNHKSLGYEITTGVLESEAIHLLRSFYDRENFHAPDEKRRRKDPTIDDLPESNGKR